MYKILRFCSGPYSEAGYVWCVAEIEEPNGSVYEEELYYDDMEEAILDLEEFEGRGFIVHEDEDYLTEEEETEIDQW